MFPAHMFGVRFFGTRYFGKVGLDGPSTPGIAVSTVTKSTAVSKVTRGS